MKGLVNGLIGMSLAVNLFFTETVTAFSSVSVPQLNHSFIVGVSGYYIQPSLFDNESIHAVNLSYHLAWEISASYIIPCTADDITAIYFYLDTVNHDSVSSDSLNAMTSSVNFFNFPLADPEALNPIPFSSVRIKAKHNLNQLDLLIGQYFNMGCHIQVHPTFGLRGLRFRRELDTNYIQSTTVTIPIATITQSQDVTFKEKSQYNGIGPWLGIDARYCFACGFDFVGHIDSVLLIGDIDVSTREVVEQIVEVPGFGFDRSLDSSNLKADSTSRIVPMIDMKLGVSYNISLNRCTKVTLEAGWTCNEYFNVIDHLQTRTTLANAGEGGTTNPIITSVNVNQRFTDDFSLNGPYIKAILYF